MPGEVIEALSVFAALYTLASVVFAAVVAAILTAMSAKGAATIARRSIGEHKAKTLVS